MKRIVPLLSIAIDLMVSAISFIACSSDDGDSSGYGSQRTWHGVTSIFLTMLFCTFGIKAMSHDIEVKNADGITIYYNFTNNGELAVTYKGENKNSFDNEYDGDVKD